MATPVGCILKALSARDQLRTDREEGKKTFWTKKSPFPVATRKEEMRKKVCVCVDGCARQGDKKGIFGKSSPTSSFVKVSFQVDPP